MQRYLENSEKLLREAQQLARLGSWEWDVATDTVVWSEEMYRIYGLSPRVFRATYEGFLEWQAREFEGHTGIRCQLRSTLRTSQLDRDVATAVFRILQEALTNVARHARAKRVTIRLARQKDGLVLEVVDDGKGISAEAARSARAIGLLGMRERALVVGGGQFSVEGSPGAGTTVRVRVPFAHAQGTAP